MPGHHLCVCACMCDCACQTRGCPAGMEFEAWYFDALATVVTPVAAPGFTQWTTGVNSTVQYAGTMEYNKG